MFSVSDVAAIEECDERRRKSVSKSTEVIVNARTQCTDINTELKRLHNLLDELPTFADNSVAGFGRPGDKRPVERPMHAYVQQYTLGTQGRQPIGVHQKLAAHGAVPVTPVAGMGFMPGWQNQAHPQHQVVFKFILKSSSFFTTIDTYLFCLFKHLNNNKCTFIIKITAFHKKM